MKRKMNWISVVFLLLITGSSLSAGISKSIVYLLLFPVLFILVCSIITLAMYCVLVYVLIVTAEGTFKERITELRIYTLGWVVESIFGEYLCETKTVKESKGTNSLYSLFDSINVKHI